jgi:hypothetical protein
MEEEEEEERTWISGHGCCCCWYDVLAVRRHRLRAVFVGTLQTECPCAQDLSSALWRQTPHLVGEDSGAAVCSRGSRPALSAGELWHRYVPVALGPPPGWGGLRSRHVFHDSRLVPYAVRLWRRHVSEAPGPPPGRAPLLPHVLWL